MSEANACSKNTCVLFLVVLAASQLRGSCLRHSQTTNNRGPHNTNASLIVSIRSLRSLILTASLNTRTRGQKTGRQEATMSWPTNEKTVANTCIRHVVACMLALPMCVHVREPQGRVSKTAYSHCKHIVMVPIFVEGSTTMIE